jgi:V/A-type H+-transporting ATPase subunit C
VLEGRILPSATYERLLDATTIAQRLRVLADSPYGRYIEGAQTIEDVEYGLERTLDSLYRFLESANLPHPVIRFFRLRYDYQNLKARMKADFFGVPVPGLLTELGTIPAEVFTGPVPLWPSEMHAVYEKVASDPVVMRSEERIALEVDRARFAATLREAREARSGFMEGLARRQVDFANVRQLLRSRSRGRAAAEVRPLLIEGGSYSAARLMALYALPAESVAGRLSQEAGPFRGVPPERLADLESYDVIADNLAVDYLRQARRVALGPEPVIGYVMARENEVTMVRMLLVGAIAGVPSDTLRHRLRDRYE